jgi:hypothetical protein
MVIEFAIAFRRGRVGIVGLKRKWPNFTLQNDSGCLFRIAEKMADTQWFSANSEMWRVGYVISGLEARLFVVPTILIRYFFADLRLGAGAPDQLGVEVGCQLRWPILSPSSSRPAKLPCLGCATVSTSAASFQRCSPPAPAPLSFWLAMVPRAATS